VKLRGFRIELGEIEAVLRQHPAVREAVAVVREDAPRDPRLVAYLVPAGHGAISTADLRAHLRDFLPEHMLPAAFVSVDALPLTPSGKVDRSALPAPEMTRRDEDEFVPPRTRAETMLAAIWCAVLDLDRVSVYDNFFDVGGHSLLAMQVIAEFERKTGFHMNPIDFFRQTLGQLAATYEPGAAVLPHQDQESSIRQAVEPFFYGTLARPLFGCYRLARSPRKRGVVLCPAHAHEYIRCHRAYRELATRLARAGYDVLTFDH
jgi:hypothetical protein